MSRRKAEMVLKLVDKATRPARRFIALQKRMGRATELANRVSARSSAAAKRATDMYTRSVARLNRAQDTLRAGVRRTNLVIAAQTARLRSSAAMMYSGVAGFGRAALIAGGIWTAYSGTVSAAGVAMLSPARQFEKFQTVLTTTEGSAQAAKEAMSWVEEFATRTPYELDQVMASFVQLRAYGLDPTNGMLQKLGNASAAMNKPLMQSVEAMADAVTGENERLKELGIKAAKVGKHFEYSYTGRDGTTKIVRALASDRQAIQDAILGIFDEKYGGAMDRLSQTFDGMGSNLLDQWTKFQRMIMGFGVFDWMKSKLKLVLDEINRLEASGELEIWAKR
ncbi:tape measure protein, partial [Ruegeria sp. HKCCD8929]|uniref:tape measure protein n=1 Tax=Ruegeria sp. HKCCD8929 TaxID=2683006 RepID=UPI0020C2F42C